MRCTTSAAAPGFCPSSPPHAAVSEALAQLNDCATLPATPPPRAVLSTIQKLGFSVTLAYVFLRFSFLHEFITAKTGFDTHLSVLFYSLSYLACLFSGRALAAWRSRSAVIWVLFSLCMCLATVTSFWRGGSFPVTSDYIRTALPLLFVFPALIVTPAQLEKVLNTIGIAGIAIVILGLITDTFKGGRLALDALGSIGNSNDYAAHLTFVLPAIAFLTLAQPRNFIVKALGIASIGMGLFEILSTGSRGGLIGLIVMGIYVFFSCSAKLKVFLVVVLPAAALCCIPFLPGEAATRLASMFSSNAQTSEAADSQESRLALLRESIKATTEHPILGVGPGVFMDYEGAVAEQNGGRGLWHVTHNSYTQVSSECGLPAFVLYICGVTGAFLALRRSSKSTNPAISRLARVLVIGMSGLCTCMIFLSNAYSANILALAGIAIAIRQIDSDSDEQRTDVATQRDVALA